MYLAKLHYLRSLSLRSETAIQLSLPLTNLRYLEVSQSTLDQLKTICSTTPQLTTLNVTVVHRTSNFEFQCQLDYLIQLVIHIDGKHCSNNKTF